MEKDIRDWMRENNLTENDLDFMWEFLSEFNTTVKGLYSHGIGWKDMRKDIIKTIPDVYKKAFYKAFSNDSN